MRWKMLRASAKTALVALFLVASFGAGLGVSAYLAGLFEADSIAFVPPTASDHEKLRDLQYRYELLKAKLDSAVEDAKRIDRLMSLLLALTGLYAVALGLHSYFGLKQVLDTAKQDAGQAVATANAESKRAIEDAERTIEALRADSSRMIQTAKAGLEELWEEVSRKTQAATRHFEEFREEIRAKYPEFANLHGNLRDLIAGMNAVFQIGEL